MDQYEMCRGCMRKVSYDERENYNSRIADMFSVCTGIVINRDDRLPKQFCNNCVKTIDLIYKYIKEAQSSNETLQQMAAKLIVYNTPLLQQNDPPKRLPRHYPPRRYRFNNNTMRYNNNIIEIKRQLMSSDSNIKQDVKNDNPTNSTEVKTEIKQETADYREMDEIVEQPDVQIVPETQAIATQTLDNLTETRATATQTLEPVTETQSGVADTQVVTDIQMIKTEPVEPTESFFIGAQPPEILDSNIIVCSECDKKFTSSLLYNEHVKLSHNKSLPFGEMRRSRYGSEHGPKCAECGASFRRRVDLAAHLRATHPSGRTHKCFKCGLKFEFRSELKIHMKKHDRDKPYQCFCGEKFAHALSLEEHKRVHRELEMFSCIECDFRTSHRSRLLRHQLQHSHTSGDFVCVLCLREFADFRSLARHPCTDSNRSDPAYPTAVPSTSGLSRYIPRPRRSSTSSDS